MTDTLYDLALAVKDDIVTRAAATLPNVDDDAALEQLMTNFRVLQMHHARVLHHESVIRGLNETDMRFVFFLSAADAPVTPKAGGEYLELTTGAMTSLVDRLESRGHIDRAPNPADRRSVLLSLTESGRQIATEVGDVYREAFRATIPTEYRLPLALAFRQMGAALEDNSFLAGVEAVGAEAVGADAVGAEAVGTGA